jgi:hypothetical protein
MRRRIRKVGAGEDKCLDKKIEFVGLGREDNCRIILG